jgi:hypothetical protein
MRYLFLLFAIVFTHAAFASESFTIEPDPLKVGFVDHKNTVTASGTWIGNPFPLNIAEITADKHSNLIHLSTAIVVTKLFPKPTLTIETQDIPIESWDEDSIISAKQRCGTSNRFIQITIDRKSKSVSQVFTGDSPAEQHLENGSLQFRKFFQKQK